MIRFRQLYEKATGLMSYTSIPGERGTTAVLDDGHARHGAAPCGVLGDCSAFHVPRRAEDPVLSKTHHPFLVGGMWTSFADRAVLSIRNPLANWDANLRYRRDRRGEWDEAYAVESFHKFVRLWAGHHTYWRDRAKADCFPVAVFRYEDLLANTSEVGKCHRLVALLPIWWG
jgi:hypothetical protein